MSLVGVCFVVYCAIALNTVGYTMVQPSLGLVLNSSEVVTAMVLQLVLFHESVSARQCGSGSYLLRPGARQPAAGSACAFSPCGTRTERTSEECNKRAKRAAQPPTRQEP